MSSSLKKLCGPRAVMHRLAAAIVASALVGGLGAVTATAQMDDQEKVQKQIEQSCIISGVCNQNGGAAASGQATLHFAAIAMSASGLNSGSSHGQNSEAEAKDLALKNCATASPDCRLLNWGSNLCFALATSRPDGFFGQAPGASRAQAAATALGQCRKSGGKNCAVQAAPCASDDPRWPAPLPLPAAAAGAASIDPAVVGTWELAINPGRWVMEIGAKGTFEFHSEAMDGAPSRAGTFSASNGNWTLNASDGWSDGGSYTSPSPSVWLATGKLGTGTWHRVASETN